MLAVYVEAFNPEDPLASLLIGERPDPSVSEGWTTVQVKAASINHHDLWSLRGVGLAQDRLPMILGCDAAGTTPDGREVVVHSVINSDTWSGDEALDPRLSLLSERHQGTLCERVAVPTANLLPKPEALSFAEAACLPTAWLTAYRMLFTQAEAQPGQTILVRGATGGLANALIALGRAAGLRMWASSRTDHGRMIANELGAHRTFAVGERLPERVDAVMDSVGGRSWTHSLRALKKGGVMVVAGGTGDYTAEVEVARVFAMNLRIIGSVMGTRAEFGRLLTLLVDSGVRPAIDQTLALRQAQDGFAAVLGGGLRGKVVLEP